MVNVQVAILLFSRLFGFFVLSPLFPKQIIPYFLRFIFTFVSFLLIAPLLFTQTIESYSTVFLVLLSLKEALLGYLLGFVISILFESLAFAGHLVSTMGGFSLVSLFTPDQEYGPIFSKLFSLFGIILFLSLDLHHFLLRLLYESFSALPLTLLPINKSFVFSLAYATSLIFQYGFSYAFLPFLVLFTVLILFSLLSKDFMIFLHGLPLQLLITLIIVAIAFSSFGEIFLEEFNTLISIVKLRFLGYILEI